MKKFLRRWFLTFIGICLVGKGFQYIIGSSSKGEVANNKTQKQGQQATQKGTSSFTFMGVGDNLLHDVIFRNQDLTNKEVEEYTSVYKTIKNHTTADLNYINYETICAGEENGFSLSGYPTFNGPTEFNDLVAKAGFNWLSLCSNHTFDLGTEGVIAELEYIQKHQPKLNVTGAYTSKKERNTPKVVTINNIRVGLASYCYGYENDPGAEYDWMVNKMDEETIRKDLKELNKVSDVQIVSMHWGTEYQTTANKEQKKYAKLLNELGVEVIIGTHPHVIEPVTWIHSDKQDTLCYYSLGNFVSAQNENVNMIGGMANFEIEYNFDTKKATVKNAKFTPTITYYTETYHKFQTYTISEWNNDLASTHYVTVAAGEDITKKFVQDYVKDVLGSPKNVEVVYK